MGDEHTAQYTDGVLWKRTFETYLTGQCHPKKFNLKKEKHFNVHELYLAKEKNSNPEMQDHYTMSVKQ